MHSRSSWTTRVLVRTTAFLLASVLTASTSAAFGALPDGVDTSHYQHSSSLNWQSVRNEGVRFAFLKATEGSTFTDPWFARDWVATQEAGIYRGAYHFARPSVGSAPAQARYFAGRIGGQTTPGTLPPVLDLEATGGLSASQLITWTRSWLDTVEQLTGRTPIIYVSPAFWKYNMANSTAFHAYPLWIANYGVSQPTVPGGWPTWTFWQGTSTGRVSGISGNVDTDVFNGSLSQLQKLAAVAAEPVSTTLSLAPSTAAPTSGQTVTFAGTMLTASGTPVAGKTIRLATRVPGTTTWSRVASATTSASGGYAVQLPVTAAAGYRARFAGDSQYVRAVSKVASVALATIPTTLSLTSSASDVPAGTTVTLSGTLNGSGPLRSMPVTLERQLPGTDTWTAVQPATTTSTGTFSVPATVTESAAYRVTYAGTATYAPATSPTRSVTVSRAATSASLRVSDTAPYRGSRIAVTGALTQGGAPVAGRTVSVVAQPAGTTGWTGIGTATTDSLGRFAVPAIADGAATYRADFAGDELFLPTSSPTQAITITGPTPTMLSLRAPADLLRRGHAMTLTAALQTDAGAPLAGRPLVLWKRLVGSSHWYRVAHAATGASGSWPVSVAPTRSALYRAEWRGGARYAASRSTAVRVAVR